jgi:hypothetical protein
LVAVAAVGTIAARSDSEPTIIANSRKIDAESDSSARSLLSKLSGDASPEPSLRNAWEDPRAIEEAAFAMAQVSKLQSTKHWIQNFSLER